MDHSITFLHKLLPSFHLGSISQFLSLIVSTQTTLSNTSWLSIRNQYQDLPSLLPSSSFLSSSSIFSFLFPPFSPFSPSCSVSFLPFPYLYISKNGVCRRRECWKAVCCSQALVTITRQTRWRGRRADTILSLFSIPQAPETPRNECFASVM